LEVAFVIAKNIPTVETAKELISPPYLLHTLSFQN